VGKAVASSSRHASLSWSASFSRFNCLVAGSLASVVPILDCKTCYFSETEASYQVQSCGCNVVLVSILYV
jgi:hypothetical protein